MLCATDMKMNILTTIGTFFLVFLSLSFVDCALENEIPAKGRCVTNSTHWGDDFGIEKLPPCWTASCGRSDSGETIILRTPCNLDYDIEYSRNDQRWLLYNHCYPSRRGELPGDQCCGGYKICAHQGVNKNYFNVINFFSFRNKIIYQPWFAKFDNVPGEFNF